MTDLTPNDLSHLSDAEFHALCPQGEHAPGPEPLSPAAQAILAAVTQQMYDCNPEDLPNESARIAYTLRLGFRALADTFPDPLPDDDFDFREGWQEAVSKIEIIATELENTDD